MQRKLRRHRLAAGEFLEHAAQHRLDRREHVLLGDEAHLDVELVELAGRAVGAGVLVAKARRDLEIAVEARHHDELLELLRRLRQRVELAGMNARRHQEVARAFRARRRQDRGLELEEALLLHAPPQRVDDGAALHDVAVQPLAPQVEEAVFEADVLGIFLVAEHRHRQFAGRPQHLDLGGEDLDGAGRQVRVVGAGRARAHPAVDPDDPFRAQLFRGLEGRRIRVGHHLGEAVMVAQIDEQQAAMVADAVTPARKPDGGTDLLGAQRAAGMGTIPMHQGLEGAPDSPARVESMSVPLPQQGEAAAARV